MTTVREVASQEADLAARLTLLAHEALAGSLAEEPPADIADRIRAVGLGVGRPVEVLVAENGTEPVGCLFFGALFPGDGFRATFFVKSITVAAAHRGQGIGRALVRRLCEMALARGVVRIDWHSSADNAGANRLYDSLGISRRDRTLNWRLDETAMRLMAETGSARAE